MAAPLSVPISSPIFRRIYDRLEFWKESGPFFRHVRQVLPGPIPREVPVGVASHPIALFVSVLPTRAAGAVAGAASAMTDYRAAIEVGVTNANPSDLDAYTQWSDTIDDLLKVVCEVEQKTQWEALKVPATYGEPISALYSDAVNVTYPRIPDLLATVAIASWTVECRLGWET